MKIIGKIKHHLNKEQIKYKKWLKMIKYKKWLKMIKYKDLKLNKKVKIYPILI